MNVVPIALVVGLCVPEHPLALLAAALLAWCTLRHHPRRPHHF